MYVNNVDITKGPFIQEAIQRFAVEMYEEDEFKEFFKNNKIDKIDEGLLEKIIDKWPSFFDGMNIEVKEDKENIKKDYYIIL
jgi:hypothetical protein